MTTSSGPARRRRTFADIAGDLADATTAAASSAPDDDAATGPPASAAPSSPAAPASADGPRVRASRYATLAGGDVRRTVYLSPDLWRAVLRLAQRRDVTAAAIVRQAVAEHVERSAGE